MKPQHVEISGTDGSEIFHRMQSKQSNAVPQILLKRSALLLLVTSWISGAIFGAYIIAFFGGALVNGNPERWNEALPGLHNRNSLPTTFAVGAHFLAGSVLLLLGPIQFIGYLRRSVPTIHRWLGRAYAISAGVAGMGGIVFIIVSGTIGGAVMDIGFGIYGALMVLCATMTYHRARTHDISRHRAWAIRLFALTIGSWLYRMEYGLWYMAFGFLGRSYTFDGWFDPAMAFLFYAPNLLIAEFFIRASGQDRGPILGYVAAAVVFTASAFITLVTINFTLGVWGPRMASVLLG